MIRLAGVLANHERAVERDLLAMGYRMTDIGTGLSLNELASVVFAAPTGSAVRWAIDGGWTPEAHLLANAQEQNAGLLELGSRYSRPGVQDPAIDDDAGYVLGPADIPRDALGNVFLDTFTDVAAFEARRQAIYQANRERAAS